MIKKNAKTENKMFKKKTIRGNTVRITAMGFLGVIVIGALLLYLPVSNRQPIAFLDALFSSVSAVCVTGLMTVTVQTQFTVFGKVILLLLIQIGGLGVIACATAFFLMLRKQITVRERVVIQESYGMYTFGGTVDMVKKVIKGTLIVEGIGAVFYMFQFVPEFGVPRGIFYSVFHAVSAFCNAGIDILGDASFAEYVVNPGVNLTTILLIIVSGIGFPVWFDIIENGKRVYRKEVPKRWWFTRLRLHSKLAILATLFLILSGTLFLFCSEYHNPDTIGNMSVGQKLMASLFQSVTTRTAGFSAISQGAMHEESKLFCCLLMFIGGSPGGTAGGVKTTTMAMLLIACITFVRGGNDMECMGRKISTANFRTGFCVVMVGFFAFVAGTIGILMAEPDSVPLIDILYETASAIGTVGLSAGLTANLTRASQMILMFLMYMGRLGPLTMALLFAGKANPRDSIRSLPEERIMVG